MSGEKSSSSAPSQHVAHHLAAIAAAGHPGLGRHTGVLPAVSATAHGAAPSHLGGHLESHHAALGFPAPRAEEWVVAPAGTVATVSELVIYPLKSGGGMSVQKAELTPRGLRWDRCWCVMDPDGFVQDQRIRPMLSMVTPRIDGDVLVLTAPAETALPPLPLPLDEKAYAELDSGQVSDRHNHKWFGKPLAARYAGDAAAEWITELCAYYDTLWAAHDETSEHSLRQPLAIMRYVTEADRMIAEAFKGESVLAKLASRLGPIPPTAGFADCAPLHLASYDSLAELNRRLVERGEEAVAIDRFRANIICGKAPGISESLRLEPHVEDSWHQFAIGGAQLTKLGDTARCVIPTTNQQTGERHNNGEPRETLVTYRPMPYGDGPHGGPTFGTWVVPHLQADEVVVLEVGMRIDCQSPVVAML